MQAKARKFSFLKTKRPLGPTRPQLDGYSGLLSGSRTFNTFVWPLVYVYCQGQESEELHLDMPSFCVQEQMYILAFIETSLLPFGVRVAIIIK
jgi:hypothetical protein